MKASLTERRAEQIHDYLLRMYRRRRQQHAGNCFIIFDEHAPRGNRRTQPPPGMEVVDEHRGHALTPPRTINDSFNHYVQYCIELILVNRIRQQVKSWREAGHPGASRTTIDLLDWWRREGRKTPLFYAQLEAAETILFLVEARADFRQGIKIPREELSAAKIADGYASSIRTRAKRAFM